MSCLLLQKLCIVDRNPMPCRVLKCQKTKECHPGPSANGRAAWTSRPTLARKAGTGLGAFDRKARVRGGTIGRESSWWMFRRSGKGREPRTKLVPLTFFRRVRVLAPPCYPLFNLLCVASLASHYICDFGQIPHSFESNKVRRYTFYKNPLRNIF